MDWDLAIERNSEALTRIVAALFAMLGLAGTETVLRIPQPLHRAVLRLLQPSESAVRRLIVIAARGLVVKPAPARPMPAGPIGKGGGNSRPSFRLFDPRKSFEALRQHRQTSRGLPRASIFSEAIPGWRPCGQRPSPPLIPLRRPMASSMPSASPGGSRPSSSHLRICRARPGVWPAGGSGGRTQKLRSSGRRSGRAILPATAGSRFTRSMRCLPNATGLPVMR
jgi:hypothetical protein